MKKIDVSESVFECGSLLRSAKSIQFCHVFASQMFGN